MFLPLEIQCRIAIYPKPTLFITAISKSPLMNRRQSINNMFRVLVPLLEKAQCEYNATFVANEPSKITHDLSNVNVQENIIICTTMQFTSIETLKDYVTKLSGRM